jgi:hypothetical protein
MGNPITTKEAATSTASRVVSQNACQSIKGSSLSGRFFLGKKAASQPEEKLT